MAALEGTGGSLQPRRKSNFQKHLDNTFKAAAIMLPHQILNVGRVSLFHFLRLTHKMKVESKLKT